MNTHASKSAFPQATYENILETYRQFAAASEPREDEDLMAKLARCKGPLNVSKDLFEQLLKEPGAVGGPGGPSAYVTVRGVEFILNRYLPAGTLVGMAENNPFPRPNAPLVSELLPTPVVLNFIKEPENADIPSETADRDS